MLCYVWNWCVYERVSACAVSTPCSVMFDKLCTYEDTLPFYKICIISSLHSPSNCYLNCPLHHEVHCMYDELFAHLQAYDSNPQRSCAVRVTILGLFVRPFVLLPHFLQLCATSHQRVIPTGSVLHWLGFSKWCFRRSTAFKSYGNDQYRLTSTTVEVLLQSQVVGYGLHSNTTYKYSYSVGVRNNRFWVRGCGLFT